jgi:hypothetical protein
VAGGDVVEPQEYIPYKYITYLMRLAFQAPSLAYRYWRVIRVGSHMIRWVLLRQVKRAAERTVV